MASWCRQYVIPELWPFPRDAMIVKKTDCKMTVNVTYICWRLLRFLENRKKNAMHVNIHSSAIETVIAGYTYILL